METPSIVMVTGKRKSGKSTLVRSMIAPIQRSIIVSAFGGNDWAKLGAIRFPDLAALKNALKEKRPRTFRVVVTIQAHELADLCRLAWVIAPVKLIFDETYNLFESTFMPREFVAVCQGGRHAGFDEQQEIGVIAIGQRPVNMPPVFRSEVDEWYLFRLNARKDRKLLEDDFGLPKEIAEKSGRLDQFHYMKVDNNGMVTYGQTSK